MLFTNILFEVHLHCIWQGKVSLFEESLRFVGQTIDKSADLKIFKLISDFMYTVDALFGTKIVG